MVGIVIVSHSQKLAEGVVEVASMMAPSVPIAAAGGLEDGELGTSCEKIQSAIESVCSEDGAVILADMGSSVMTVEIVLEDMQRDDVKLLDCPIVEGAVLAAMESLRGFNVDELATRVERARGISKFID